MDVKKFIIIILFLGLAFSLFQAFKCITHNKGKVVKITLPVKTKNKCIVWSKDIRFKNPKIIDKECNSTYIKPDRYGRLHVKVYEKTLNDHHNDLNYVIIEENNFNKQLHHSNYKFKRVKHKHHPTSPEHFDGKDYVSINPDIKQSVGNVVQDIVELKEYEIVDDFDDIDTRYKDLFNLKNVEK